MLITVVSSSKEINQLINEIMESKELTPKEQLIEMISSCLEKHKEDENMPENPYYNNEAHDDEEEIFLFYEKHFGDFYNLPNSEEHGDWLLKATPVEFWQYYLDVIMPLL